MSSPDAPDGLVWVNPRCRFFAISHWPEMVVHQRRDAGGRTFAWNSSPMVPDIAVRVNLRRERRLSIDDPAIEIETFLTMPTIRWTGGNSRTRRRREFLARIPEDVLRTVMAYPRHHLSLLRLAASHPYAAQLLRPWPEGAPALAYAIAKRMAKSTDPDVVRALCWLARRKRRAIAEALGLPNSAYAVRLLGRLPSRILTRLVLPDAINAARHPHHALHTRQAQELQHAVVAVAASDCLRPLLTPALVRDLNVPQLIATRAVDALITVRAALGDVGGPASDRERRRRVRPINGLYDLDTRIERRRKEREAMMRRGKTPPPLPLPKGPNFDNYAVDGEGCFAERTSADVPPVHHEILENWEDYITTDGQQPVSRWLFCDEVLGAIPSFDTLPREETRVSLREAPDAGIARFVTCMLRGEPSATVLLEQRGSRLHIVAIQSVDGTTPSAMACERARHAVAVHNARFGGNGHA